jgi:protein-tyrosine phosphatase
MMDRPIADSYWVLWPAGAPSRLLAGEYPGARVTTEAEAKVDRLLTAGVTLFIDLTEAGEYNLRPYAELAQQVAARSNKSVSHRRLSIPDLAIPTGHKMGEILDTIDTALVQDETIYVHCFGGIGRTGTVIGCWLVRHGLDGDEALAHIARWREGTPDGWRTSPETAAQRQMVLNWSKGS